jgi:hypothetical protein
MRHAITADWTLVIRAVFVTSAGFRFVRRFPQ